jgi:hypothetical protein
MGRRPGELAKTKTVADAINPPLSGRIATQAVK